MQIKTSLVECGFPTDREWKLWKSYILNEWHFNTVARYNHFKMNPLPSSHECNAYKTVERFLKGLG